MQFVTKLIAPLCVVAMSAGAVQAQDSDVDFQQSTNDVLAALGVAVAAPDVVVTGDLISIIGEAMASGESDDYINALVMEAHSEGQIEVPDSMTDGTGEVDSAAMLTAVVNAAIAAQPAQPASEVTTLVVEASGNQEVGGRTHTVESGDTLLRIAQDYYGTAGSYQQILNANPNITNANLINIGMVLSIP